MNQENPQSSVKDKVLEAIAKGQVTMRPRWHFILKAALIIVGAIMLALTLLYLVSFIIFSLRQSGAWFVPSFGFRGLWLLLVSMPWVLIGITIIFFIIVEVLVRHYSFAYRQPLLYSALAIVAVVTVSGIAVAQTPLHGTFFKQAQEHRLPLAEPMYLRFGAMHSDGIQRGIINELTENGFRMNTKSNQEFSVIVTPETTFPLGTNFSEGDAVVVIGNRDDSTITAEGIRKIDELPWEARPRRPSPRRFTPPFPRQ